MNKLIFILGMFFSLNALAKIETLSLNLFDGCSVNTVISTPSSKQETIKDFMFLIGYGDQALNHLPLFKKLSDQGIRVISFDYPEHGSTACGKLNQFTITDLMNLTAQVDKMTRITSKRPLVLAGWSTGGLIATRIVQDKVIGNRSIETLILLAPGLSVYKLVGGDGIIRESTLTSNPNPEHAGPPSPVSPLLTPMFSTSLLAQGLLARANEMPNVNTLVILAGDRDLYAKSENVSQYFLNQKINGKKIKGIQCKNSMHELDNEIDSISSVVRNNILKMSLNSIDFKIQTNDQCKEIF